MRRKEREVTNLDEILQILQEGQVMRVAMNNGTYPYVVPVNYGYHLDGDTIVLSFHGANEGQKHDILAKDNHVTVEIDCEHQLLQPVGEESCTASFAYASIIAHGLAEKVCEEEKERYLNELLAHYHIPHVHYHPAHFANTVIYRIVITDYTAKRRKMDR